MKKQFPQDVWKFIDIRDQDECWPWLGRTTTKINGYGYIGIQRQNYVAHRVVWFLTYPNTIELKAPIDKSIRQFVLHKCDNRICCNPKHMFLGNYLDNIQDKVKKGRSPKDFGIKGTKNYASKLTEKQVIEIRWLASKFISNGEIERLYPVCNEAIRRVVKGVSYVGI